MSSLDCYLLRVKKIILALASAGHYDLAQEVLATAIRYKDTSTGKRVRIEAFDGKERVGWLIASVAFTYVELDRIEVVPTHRRQGIAIELYKLASATSCKRFKKSLVSYDYARSPEASTVWERLKDHGAERISDPAGFIFPCK